jgi:hypothetical protein
MVMAVVLLLGATLTAQANFIPARKSPTEFFKRQSLRLVGSGFMN